MGQLCKLCRDWITLFAAWLRFVNTKAVPQHHVNAPPTTPCTRAQVRSIVEEYFASGSIDDVADSLEELGGVGHLAHYFVKRLVTAALDRKDREREMASTLLSSLYAEVRAEVVGEGRGRQPGWCRGFARHRSARRWPARRGPACMLGFGRCTRVACSVRTFKGCGVEGVASTLLSTPESSCCKRRTSPQREGGHAHHDLVIRDRTRAVHLRNARVVSSVGVEPWSRRGRRRQSLPLRLVA